MNYQPFSIGLAEPSAEAVRFVLSVRPQRRCKFRRLMLRSHFLANWAVIRINCVDLVNEVPAMMFNALGFPVELYARATEPGEEIAVTVEWRGPLLRFPEYLSPRQAWRPCYRRAWWVSRTRPPSMALQGVVLVSFDPSEK